MRRALLAAVALQLAACGGGTRPLPPAAEPAQSPPPAQRPAGREVSVGRQPEGIAVTGAVVVAVRDPAQLVIIRGRVLRRVPISAPARHLATVGGVVLVPAEPIDRLLELSLRGGSVRSIPVGAHPHDAAAAAGRVFVGDEFGRSVSVIEGARVVRRIGGFVQPGGLVAFGRSVAVVDVRANSVTLIDARSLHVTGSAPAGRGPTHAVSDGSRLFVVDTRGGAVLAYTAGPRFVGRRRLPGSPYGIAADRVRHRLWVTLTGRDELVELEDRSLGVVGRYPTDRQPNTVAVDARDGTVFVAAAGSGAVERIDARR